MKEYLEALKDGQPRRIRVNGSVHFKAEVRQYVASVKVNGETMHKITREGLKVIGLDAPYKEPKPTPRPKKKAAGKKK